MNVFGGVISFGMGPLGKLATIIEVSEDIQWFGCGEKMLNGVFATNPFLDCCWSKEPEILRAFAQHYQIVAAVVVLDAELALILESIGISVVYVDSLPFLWTEGDILPSDVSVYCAQLFPELPQTCWNSIQSIKRLRWVNAIVLPGIQSQPKTLRCGVVVNFGGVHSSISSGFEYVDVVLPPLLRGLFECGFNNVTVTGSADVVEYMEKTYSNNVDLLLPKGIKYASLPHHDFIDKIAFSTLLITSPGLTTLLETFELDVPTLLLPPQNFSQYTNSSMYHKYTEGVEVITWPQKSLQLESLKPLANFGELCVVAEIYNAISKSVGNSAVADYIQREIISSIKRLEQVEKRSLLPKFISSSGAFDVLGFLYQLVKIENK